KRWFIPPPPPPPPILLPPSSPKPWPQYSDIGCHLCDRLNVFLFLQDRYLAGVWESTKVLIQNLVEINRERRQLALTLGLHRDQIQVESLESLGEELRIQRMSLNPISKPEIIEMLGHAPA